MPAKAAPKKSKSVKKRIRQTKKRTLKNRSIRSALKNVVKKVESSVSSGNADEARTSLMSAIRAIDRARSKGIIHRNNAARKVSRLTRMVNSLSRPAAT